MVYETKSPDSRNKPPGQVWDNEKGRYVYPSELKYIDRYDSKRYEYDPNSKIGPYDKDGNYEDPRFARFGTIPKSKKEQEKSMANKFLPFVVENSTPLHIFKTLLSRSKGMNQVLIASTFHLILSVNIKELRDNVKDLPEMPLEKLYEELLIKRPSFRIKDEVLATYQNIVQFFPENDNILWWKKELHEYSTNDVMIFFCSMAYANKLIDDYTDFPYNLIMEKNSADTILGNIQGYVQFEDQGMQISFDNVIELRCFILYHGIFRKMMDPNWIRKTYNATIKYVKK